MRNPFRYGARVSGGAFFDRERIMRDMLGVVDGGNNIVLYGPRRYGKSSLVGEVMTRLRAKGWVCAEVNMMDVASLEDFVSQYSRALYREASPAIGTIRHVAGLFRRVSPKIGIDDEGLAGRQRYTSRMAMDSAEFAELRTAILDKISASSAKA